MSGDTEGTEGGGSREGAHLDPTGQAYRLQDGGVVRLYGGLGYRWWLGQPGLSELVAGTAYFWEPLLVGDREEFEQSLQQQVRARVRAAVEQRTGLLVSGSDLGRIEWLAIWVAEPDLVDRLAAFEQGWSRALPRGVRARDLGAADVQKLGRLLGRKRPRARPTPRYDPAAEVVPDRSRRNDAKVDG